jgi:hypothetical protein
MLSFETSNGKLNRHGALVADDGTVLVPNGKCSALAWVEATRQSTIGQMR